MSEGAQRAPRGPGERLGSRAVDAGRDRRVLMAVIFFPRGGSAQVMRYLARSLPQSGWRPTVLTGSLGGAGDPSNAESFYSGIDIRAVDYTASARADDPLAADPPFQPSYEDRPAA